MSAIKPSGIVTLLTDFGLQDPFVGVMKGVIYKRFPAARIVDLTHGIEAQDVAEAAYWLAASYSYFDEGTVHVAVVDPGVGTDRSALAVEAGGHYFIAPDNGLLAPVLAQAGRSEIRRIDVARLDVRPISRTFHGRDVFAPAAADLAGGARWLPELGPITGTAHPSAVPHPTLEDGRLRGAVVTVDRFGNLITNVRSSWLGGIADPVVKIGNRTVPLLATYGQAPHGDLIAVINAFDALEVAQVNGDAARTLDLGKGAPVTVFSANRLD